ncbi:response regulator transcription factor [Pedobacter sp. Leaf170]|uniref:response regulator transcription factor n=1 Tax=Pedobacter sp. Leaf170 TaxID=2876558 RepID=UPI001E429D30|nr:response regulator transcription factor [Pedobacter sp. Leaf170]
MISISIVEDHDKYRKALVSAIEQNDLFSISGIYVNAEEAIEGLMIHTPNIVIIDIKLKMLSGIDLINQIKALLPDTQFLICTGYQNDEHVFSALKAGASGYIVKGASYLEIQNAIVELYNGGAPMSPYIARKVIGMLQQKTDENKFGLSHRELEVLSSLSEGLLYKEISEKLNISQNTVKNHCKNIYKRLHVQNKIEALNKFAQYNFNGFLLESNINLAN